MVFPEVKKVDRKPERLSPACPFRDTVSQLGDICTSRKLILLSSSTPKKYDCTIEWEVWNSNVGQPGVCPANQFGQGKKEHRNQLAAKVPDSPFLHLGASVLTNAGGLVLWSVRTADCYRRFDAADTEPKRNHFNGHQQKSGREKKKANYSPLHCP